MGLWWNGDTHLFKRQTPKGLRVQISPSPLSKLGVGVAQLAEDHLAGVQIPEFGLIKATISESFEFTMVE